MYYELFVSILLGGCRLVGYIISTIQQPISCCIKILATFAGYMGKTRNWEMVQMEMGMLIEER